MSAKSIRAFENAYPHRAPRPAVLLRNEAAKLRAKAQSMLGQASTLEQIADAIDGTERVPHDGGA